MVANDSSSRRKKLSLKWNHSFRCSLKNGHVWAFIQRVGALLPLHSSVTSCGHRWRISDTFGGRTRDWVLPIWKYIKIIIYIICFFIRSILLNKIYWCTWSKIVLYNICFNLIQLMDSWTDHDSHCNLFVEIGSGGYRWSW